MNNLIKASLKTLLSDDSGEAYLCLRKQEKDDHGLKRYFIKLRYGRMMQKYGCFLPFSAKIANSVCFPHGIYGIFISQGAEIGENCTIFHHVTIGSNTFKDSKHYGAPHIGDNVFIGAGAKIMGGIKIGDSVRIGAGCIVAEDIPAGATVVMPKPHVILHDEARDNSFVNFSKGR